MNEWWLISNRHGGISVAHGADPAEAKAAARQGIVEAFLSEGLSTTAARRGAASYQVYVVAGGLTHAEAREAAQAWDHDHRQAAEVLRDRWLRQRRERRNAAVRGPPRGRQGGVVSGRPNPARAVCPSDRCRAAVRWWLTTAGKDIATDYARDQEAGRLVVVERRGEQRLRVLGPADTAPQAAMRYTPHWASCPDPDVWRVARRAADPSGYLPLRTARRAREAATTGPCVRCSGPNPRRYGPNAHPLCDTCQNPEGDTA